MSPRVSAVSAQLIETMSLVSSSSSSGRWRAPSAASISGDTRCREW